ncbi:MAG: RrF2 family transcriptional regulator [Candidatus Polarisedimenticolia bacterium]
MASNSRFPVAVHVLTALAYHDGDWLSSPMLAESVRTNPVVIRRLLARLGKAGLVRTQTGKSGGVRLARRAASITLLDVFRAVEGGSPFVIPDKPENKACAVSCAMKRLLSSVLAETDRAMSRSLEKVRLSDLVKEVAVEMKGTG